jgi:hypothetical protein
MIKLLTTSILISFISWTGCNDGIVRKQINPNGDSELAILMRDMFDEGMEVKQSVINSESPQMKLAYHHIHTAKPTEEGKNVTLEYQLFAKAYEASVERFKNASEDDRPAAYQNMVDNCMNCHSKVCRGPMVKIKKMYLSEEEMNVVND